jgi:PAS domain-containing protein
LDTLLPGNWTQSLIPHGYCISWNPSLLWTFVAADTIIAISYFSIPFALWYFIHRRPDISQRPLVALFALFIISCGINHIFDVMTIWLPMYWANAISKTVTAIVSLITAIMLWKIMPSALQTPSLRQLEEANKKLAETHAALELRVSERTSALANSEEQLRAVLAGAELGFWDWNILTNEVIRNERWAKILGYSAKEIA